MSKRLGLVYYLGKELLGSHAWRACLREIRQSDPAELSREYLRAVLQHAADNVPFYRSLRLDDIRLDSFPILTKSTLRVQLETHIRDDTDDLPQERITTSGTTGTPVEFVQDANVVAWTEAADAWYLSQLLHTPRWRHVCAPKVYVWHRRLDLLPPATALYRLGELLAPIQWLEPYEALHEESLVAFGREINREKPRFIWGFPSVLYEIARAAERRNLKLHRPQFVISSGETLHTFMRPVIEEGFGCRVYEYYGSAEAGRVAGECGAGNLHLFTFNCHSEIVDSEDCPTEPGREGRLVLTTLHNYAMPLIRYDTEDIAVSGPSECPCGCTLPTLKRIVGRRGEFLVTREGHLVAFARISHLVRRCGWVLSFQLLQRDVDHVVIFFVPLAGRTAESQSQDMRAVDEAIGGILGGDCEVDWQEVDEIPRTPSGKRPYARSLVWEARCRELDP